MYKPRTELEELKKVLRSLLVSSKRPLSPKELQNDYRRMEARCFPFRKFGYSTFEDFLLSIPDVCSIEFEDGRPSRVFPVLTKQLEYIAHLVSKQREPVVSAQTKRPAKKPGAKKCVPANIQYSVFSYISRYPKGVCLEKMRKDIFSKFPLALLGFEDLEDFLESISHIVRSDRGYVYPLLSSSSDSLGHNSNNIDSQNLPALVLDNIKRVMEDNPNGILLSDFLTAYKKRIGMTFDPLKYGYINILSMVLAYPDILHAFRIDEEDFMIIETPKDWKEMSNQNSLQQTGVKNDLLWLIRNFPDGLPVSQLAEVYKVHFLKNLQPEQEGFKDLLSLLQKMAELSEIDLRMLDETLLVLPVDTHSKNKLQQINHSEDYTEDDLNQVLSHYYPVDVVMPGTELHCQQPPDTQPGALLPVTICHAVSPGHFWAVINCQNNCDIFDQLIDSMQSFYNNRNDEYKMSDPTIQVGQYCVCPFHGEWHRAQITNITNTCEVQVYLIDLGVLCKKKNHHLRFLTQEFGKMLPAQALNCRLSGIAPNGSRTWSTDISQYFSEMVVGEVFTARITSIEPQSNVISVDLLEETPCGSTCSVADRLLSEGFAVTLESVKKTKPIRLSLNEQLEKFTCI